MNKITTPKVALLWSTPEPREVVAIAGRMTYSSKAVEELAEGLKEKEIETTINAILERHHLSVLRHVVFMFSISGVSRAFSHQLVRHNIGHAYEQRSQHYRTEKDFNLIMPGTLDPESEAEYIELAKRSQQFYDDAVARGVPKDDARFGLPNGVETMLVWTANLEALLNFVQARACRVNTPEIMQVAIMVRKIVLDHFPEMKRYLGPTCFTRGTCYEGKKFFEVCNKPWRSPTVLWTPRFPFEIELVGVGGSIKIIDTLADVDKKAGEIKVTPFVPVNYPTE